MTAGSANGHRGTRPTPEVAMPAVHDAVEGDPVSGPIDLDTAADLDDLLDLPGADVD